MNPAAQRDLAGWISPSLLDLPSIAGKAATLEERLNEADAALAPAPPRSEAPPAAPPESGLLAGWCRMLAGGDWDAFAHRLSWDGWEAGQVAGALDADRPAARCPEWIAWLPALAGAARSWGDLNGSDEWREELARVAPAPEPPFLELLLPAARVAQEELGRRLAKAGEAAAALSDAVLSAFQRQIVADAAPLAELALYERFHEHGSYERFVRTMLEAGLVPLFDRYPVLARHLCILLESSVQCAVEIACRVHDDRAALGSAFGGDPGAITGVRTALSDRHHGGRRVAILEFASGLRLVYKPRDVDAERTFYALLDWLSAHGCRWTPPSLEVVARAGYGWIECARADECRTPGDVETWYRRAGSLLCLAYVTRASDLHHENIVATREGPALVDAETLFQPVERAASGEGDDGNRSCLASGLLTMIRPGTEDPPVDDGGLREALPRTVDIGARAWRHLGSDALAYERRHEIPVSSSNVPRLRGEVQRPDDYAGQLVEGFVDTYEFLRRHREALLAHDGPFERFRGCPARVVFRPSEQYAALLYVLAAPRYQGSGRERSVALDALNRVFIGHAARPHLWPLVRDERDALERLDVPRITVANDDTRLRTSTGEWIDGHFGRSGFDAACDRLQNLGDADLARQRDLLGTALAGPLPPAEPGASAGDGRSMATPARAASDFVRTAETLGLELMRRASVRDDGSIAWPACGGDNNAYAGHCGPMVALAALAAVTGSGEWRCAARGAFDAMLAHDFAPGDRSTGAFRGTTSVAYAILLAGRLAGFEDGVRDALRIAAGVNDELIRAATGPDVVDGLAGSLLVFLALHDRTTKPWLMDRARACADRLLSLRRTAAPAGRAWADRQGHIQPGFAHGAAGIAAALAALAERSHDARLPAAVADAWAFERASFSRTRRNWPALARDGRPVVMTAWCHGAPGIGLAAALVDRCGQDAAPELRVAMDITATAPSAPFDHLCCGNLGRADVLLTAGRAGHRNDWIASAQAIGRRVADRIARQGRVGVRARGFDAGAAEPGLLQGLSGIIYQMLRLEAPAAVPSVLAVETI